MLYLVDGNFKATFRGPFVRVQMDDQFIFDTEIALSKKGTDLTVGQLVEFASANNIEINSTKKSDVVAELCDGLSNLKIREINEMTDSQKAEQIIIKAEEDGLGEEATLLALVNGGVPFKKANKLYTQVRVQLGLEVSASDRKTQINDYLAKKGLKPKEYADTLAIVASLQGVVPGLTSSQALSGINKFAKENQIEMPKKPKAVKKARGGFKTQLQNWIVSNASATQAELEDFIAQNKKPESMAKRYSAMLEVANRVAASFSEEAAE